VNNRMQAKRSLRLIEPEHNPKPRMGLQVNEKVLIE
jgi:hypothetical protein